MTAWGGAAGSAAPFGAGRRWVSAAGLDVIGLGLDDGVCDEILVCMGCHFSFTLFSIICSFRLFSFKTSLFVCRKEGTEPVHTLC